MLGWSGPVPKEPDCSSLIGILLDHELPFEAAHLDLRQSSLRDGPPRGLIDVVGQLEGLERLHHLITYRDLDTTDGYASAVSAVEDLEATRVQDEGLGPFLRSIWTPRASSERSPHVLVHVGGWDLASIRIDQSIVAALIDAVSGNVQGTVDAGKAALLRSESWRKQPVESGSSVERETADAEQLCFAESRLREAAC